MRDYNYWTFDADLYCTPCAVDKYGDYLYELDAKDREGNPFHPVFPWEEHEFVGYPCGGCLEVVA